MRSHMLMEIIPLTVALTLYSSHTLMHPIIYTCVYVIQDKLSEEEPNGDTNDNHIISKLLITKK